MASTPTKRAKAPATPSEDIFDLIGRSENIREAADAMQAMGHPLRLKILCLVGSEELSVLEIVEAVGTTQSNVSQHLAVLREDGLVSTRREAQTIYYALAHGPAERIIAALHDLYCGNDAKPCE